MSTNVIGVLGFLFILSGLFTSCSNQTDSEKDGLKGKVKSVQLSTYSTKSVFGVWESTGEELWKETKHYDEKGRYISQEYASNKFIPKYEQDILVEENQYLENGDLAATTKFKYISKNEIELIRFHENGDKLNHEVKYFENKRHSKTLGTDYLFGADSIKYTIYLIYDDSGNITQRKIVYTDEEKLYNYEYIEFDDKKNWIKRLTFIPKNGKEPAEIAIRKIEYFSSENNVSSNSNNTSTNNNSSNSNNDFFGTSEAQKLIVAALNLPKECTEKVAVGDEVTLSRLKQGGAIVEGFVNNSNFHENYIEVSESNKKYFLGKITSGGSDYPSYLFKTFNLDLGKIEGISVNKENQTAQVRFTIEYKDVSPFGRILGQYTSEGGNGFRIDIEKPITAEFNFRLFDTGWKLEITESIRGYSLLDQIIYENAR